MRAGFAARPVVIVSAPPGYGKTAAALQWLAATSMDAGWVSFEHEVGSTTELLRWVDAALTRGVRGFAEAGTTPRPVPSLGRLAETVAALRYPVALVVDNAHRAAAALADPAVMAFLDNAPVNLRVLLVGHGELVARLNRLIVHDRAAVVDAEALAFDHADLRAVAARQRVSLSSAQVDALLARSNGWPIAVRTGMADRDSAVVTEYIADTVVASLPPALAEFVLAATTVDRVDASLAEALTGRSDAAELLERCRGRSLFLDRFDDPHQPEHRTVYQWHRLFAHSCREIVAVRSAERAVDLHRAAAHHLRADIPLAAAREAVLAGEDALAYAILLEEWLAAVVKSEVVELDEVCAMVLGGTSPAGEHRAVLNLVQACCRDSDGDRAGAALMRRRAARLWPADPSAEAVLVRDLAAMICSDDRAEIGAAAARTADALAGGEGGHPLDAPTGTSLRACALFITGWTELRLRRDPRLAVDLLGAARRACRAAQVEIHPRMVGIERWVRANETFALAASGQFRAAMALAAEADGAGADDTVGSWDGYDSDIEQFSLGFVALWRGDCERALAVCTELSPVDDVREGYQPLARVYRVLAAVAIGDPVAVADAEVGLGLMPASDLHGVAWTAFIDLARARIAEFRGDRAVVAATADRLLDDARSMPAVIAALAASCARMRMSGLAADLLDRVEAAQSPPYIAAQIHVVEAMVSEAAGNTASAQESLQLALTAAAPELVLLPFVDGSDRGLTALLGDYTGVHQEFVARCLAAPAGRRTGASGAASSTSLTKREAELVGLLRSQLSMAEIAAMLHISQNTLNSHRKSLYRKLGAANRREALRLARAIGA